MSAFRKSGCLVILSPSPFYLADIVSDAEGTVYPGTVSIIDGDRLRGGGRSDRYSPSVSDHRRHTGCGSRQFGFDSRFRRQEDIAGKGKSLAEVARQWHINL